MCAWFTVHDGDGVEVEVAASRMLAVRAVSVCYAQFVVFFSAGVIVDRLASRRESILPAAQATTATKQHNNQQRTKRIARSLCWLRHRDRDHHRSAYMCVVYVSHEHDREV